MNKPPAIVLLSGGLDSATVLAMANQQGFACHALSFDYQQRHQVELRAARDIAHHLGAVEHKIIKIALGELGGSALTDKNIAVPEARPEAVPKAGDDDIPVTYVPARNTIFLAFALAYAETRQASDIFIGVNAVDYSGYPDCRPAFIKAFAETARLATRAGLVGQSFAIHTPLIGMHKAEIIRTGSRLGVDYDLTISCYQADEAGQACGRCDACRFRRQGFTAASITDPTVYAND